ncbi:TatD family hydrolase [Dactylococcopsis salina]|uniref:D-aminoacyl-tRNA deacylase n=1 Tax=Dactylococcopsis salina (strain PCC 8305) TaxID=13035 RepID=K9YSB0_DACS8|nr:TatD family hydrolase [Dactylococcopsis salina]AFZ49397.1 hydrolase, TatD family [Dactylococcopsis salina PCC 8305]
MQLIDTHVHINFDVFEAELAELKTRWQEQGVVQLVHSCVEPKEYAQISAIAQQFPEVSFAVGLHPLEARKWKPELAQETEQLAQSDPRVVAIGETGLDLYKAENVQEQRNAFWNQLSIAQRLNKPVIIHCRDATTELVELVSKFQTEKGAVKGVMHCWAGSPEETEICLNLGFYISFSGLVTFKNAKTVQSSAQIVPDDRLLVETDCPFLAPVPKRGKRNEPSYVRYVAETVANLRNTPLETLAETTTRNARELFSLPSISEFN